jgi:sugar lactone lactonase YvrE
VFARTEPPNGYPDGSTVDAEGFLWNAEYAGSRLVRYAPDGRIDRTVALPVSQPTSCAFGGSRLDVLYVTSSRQRMTPEQIAKEPMAGGLFALDVGVKGLAEPRFAG